MLRALSFWSILVLDRYVLRDVVLPAGMGAIRGGARIGVGDAHSFADETDLDDEVRAAVDFAMGNPRAVAVVLVETDFFPGDETHPPRWRTRATEVHDLDALRALEALTGLFVEFGEREELAA